MASEGKSTADDEQWMTAAEALRVVAAQMGDYPARLAIAGRANDGLVRTKADSVFNGERCWTDTEIPKEFWWARGEAALTQNWTSGDFETWIKHESHWRAYGVRFLRADIEKIVPPSDSAVSATRTKISKKSRRVFVVHGHDEAPRLAVADLLRQIGFEPIILHEKPNEGARAVIEKFESHADVAFAVVLLTPDDEGRERHASELRPRPRQNVLLELGYFVGRLDRKHVCVVTRGDDIEWPSDLLGVLHVPYDTPGAWKFALADELKAAGFEVDKNKIKR